MKTNSASRPTDGRIRVDGREFAHYQENPGSPDAEQRFALHVLSRYPGDVWAATTMALHEKTDAGLEKKIRLAIRIGLRLMTARLVPGEDVVVRGDPEGEATLMAMRHYADHLALRGRAEAAQDMLKMMLELDPDDTVEAIPTLEGRGVVVGSGMAARMN